jgi:Transposase DDE domain
VLPRQTVDEKSKERYLSRLLGNDLIVPLTVRGGFIPEIAEITASKGKTIALSMDQSKISDGLECLMLSIRTGERALPAAWKGKETSAGIGFDLQEPLLNAVHAMIPEGLPVLLAGDRF